MNYAALIAELKQQEQELQFPSFSNADAVTIGLDLYSMAKERNLPITIDITRNGQQLFHLAMPGTSADNDQWIIRKCRLVNRFQMSSFRMGTELRSEEHTLESRYELSHYEYAAHGGCFPILIRDTGMVGTITVSGLAQEDDHALVVEAITNFLKKQT